MLSKKPGSQEQFFKLFNDMTNKNKQIVITSDRTPTQLEGFMDRLTSRFSFGLSVDIHQPDYSQRVEILKKKALEKTEKTVPDNVLSFIAEKFLKLSFTTVRRSPNSLSLSLALDIA